VLVLFIVLAGLSLAAMIVGVVWAVVVGGQVETREGPEVGAEIMSGQMADDDEEGITLGQWSVARGQGREVRGETSISFSDIKGMVRAGEWGRALPALLVIVGLFGLLLFASLAALVGLEDSLVGLAALAVTLYVIIRTVINIARG